MPSPPVCWTPASSRPEAVAVLGTTKSQRITTMITDLIEHSQNGRINFSPEVDAAYAVLKDFMYSTVYVDKEAKREEKKVDKLVAELYERLCEEPTLMPNFYLQIAYNEGVDRAVTDYISGMSDEFATRLFEDLFVPKSGRFYDFVLSGRLLPAAARWRHPSTANKK